MVVTGELAWFYHDIHADRAVGVEDCVALRGLFVQGDFLVGAYVHEALEARGLAFFFDSWSHAIY